MIPCIGEWNVGHQLQLYKVGSVCWFTGVVWICFIFLFLGSAAVVGGLLVSSCDYDLIIWVKVVLVHPFRSCKILYLLSSRRAKLKALVHMDARNSSFLMLCCVATRAACQYERSNQCCIFAWKGLPEKALVRFFDRTRTKVYLPEKALDRIFDRTRTKVELVIFVSIQGITRVPYSIYIK